MRIRAGLVTALQVALPLLAALTLPPVPPGSGVLWPWGRELIDLEVYQTIGNVVLSGGDIITARSPGGWAFIYPPFAALLCIPLVLFSPDVLAFGWTIVSALALVAVLYRCGLRGWTLSAVASVVLVLCDPVRSTLTYGQVNLLLLALVVLDLVPGPTILGRRPLLPKGVLTGLAAAIKLTPLLFAVYLWLARTRRAAIVAAATFVGYTLVAALVLPSASAQFVTGLLHGETRTGGVHYIMNQSVLAAMSRVAGGGSWQLYAGLAISAVVALAGAYAAALWFRHGSPLFAVALCGIATILASPISWNHHLVWVVPLGVALLDRGLPYAIRVTGWFLVGWASLAPYKVAAPSTGDIELHWNAGQQLVVALTPIAGVALVCLSLGYAWRLRSRQPQPSP